MLAFPIFPQIESICGETGCNKFKYGQRYTASVYLLKYLAHCHLRSLFKEFDYGDLILFESINNVFLKSVKKFSLLGIIIPKLVIVGTPFCAVKDQWHREKHVLIFSLRPRIIFEYFIPEIFYSLIFRQTFHGFFPISIRIHRLRHVDVVPTNNFFLSAILGFYRFIRRNCLI